MLVLVLQLVVRGCRAAHRRNKALITWARTARHATLLTHVLRTAGMDTVIDGRGERMRQRWAHRGVVLRNISWQGRRAAVAHERRGGGRHCGCVFVVWRGDEGHVLRAGEVHGRCGVLAGHVWGCLVRGGIALPRLPAAHVEQDCRD